MATTIDRPAPAGHRHRQGAVTVYLAFLGILLAFGVDVALPAFDEIADDFGLDPDNSPISLVGTLYFLGMAFGQLVYGPVSDRFGRRPALLVGLGLYAFGAVSAALAPSFGLLLVSRLVWGLGAAAPGALRVAIARDLYDGDRMAKVVTLVMAVFMIGPIFVPAVGEVLLALGPWPIVFHTGAALALASAAWTWWFGETLADEHRRPLRLRPLADATRIVVRTRPTIGNIMAQTFFGAAFFIYLGSSQPILDVIYDRADQFAVIFGGSGVLMVLFLLVNSRLIPRFGAQRMANAAAVAVVGLSASGVLYIAVVDSSPSVWAWVAWSAVTNALLTTLTPLCNALALEPMGSLAGTASAVLGALTLGLGAILAAVFDQLITTSVTPMAVGYVVYTTTALAALRWAATGPAPSLRP